MEATKALFDTLALEIEVVSKTNPVCPMLLGEPGIGKSSIVRAMCEEHNWHFFELLCNQLADTADLTGCRSVKDFETLPDGTKKEIWKQIFFPHSAVQDAISCAKANPNEIVVLFLDEINRTTSSITSAILSFTTARKIGTEEFPSNIRFIVAGNDKGNVVSLDSASLSRFVLFPLEPSAKTWMDITDELNPYIQKVLTQNPEYIFCKEAPVIGTTVKSDDDDDDEYETEYSLFDETEGFSQITTPRTLSGLNAFLNACSADQLKQYVAMTYRNNDGEETNMLEQIIAGHVGYTLFQNALCAIIADDIQRGILQSANTIPKPTKPAVYDSIMRCTDRQTRDNMIGNLTDEDKSEIILYATYEKGVDNSDLIVSVASQLQTNMLTNDVMPRFTQLKTNDMLDVDNYAALITSNTNLGNIIKSIFGD